jgi:hypothetical protein
MVDLRRTDADKRAELAEYGGKATPERLKTMEDYPYGLSINLDGAAMAKLGIDATSFAAGASVTLVAGAMVRSMTSETVGGKVKQSMTLQLQRLGIEEEPDSSETILKRMYGGRDAD